MSESFIERIVELFREDVLLHDALLRLIEAKREAENARARWYERRAKGG
ncbi:hypothetical protein ES705_31587 [subsurface metagenome]